MQAPRLSAVILTIGEKTFPFSYQSLENQNIPFEDLVVVRDVRPFSKAFNDAVCAVKTPFFLQCDADMILDANCVQTLLEKMKDGTGMVVGLLRDPLQGTIQGVKLYRTECCKQFPMTDSFNCEVVFRQDLLKHGWSVEVLDPKVGAVGSHETDLTNYVYQFERFKFLGVKIYERRAWYDFTYRLIQLSRSVHQELLPPATAAMICGMFLTYKSDHLKGYMESQEYRLFCERTRVEKPSPSKSRIYTAAGIYNFLFGYQDGLLFVRRKKQFHLQPLIYNFARSFSVSQWSYLLGFCASLMNSTESISQNRMSRFRRMKPLLKYLRHNLHSFPEHLST